MLPIVMALIQAGLPILANAVATKGKEAIEAKTGIKLPEISFGQALTPEQAVSMKKLEIDHEEWLGNLALEEKKIDYAAAQAEDKEVSTRWTSDNSTDSWLAKNVRPVLMLALFSALVLFALMSIPSIGQPIGAAWIDLFKSLAQAAFYAYFGGRTVEKTARHISENWGGKAVDLAKLVKK